MGERSHLRAPAVLILFELVRQTEFSLGIAAVSWFKQNRCHCTILGVKCDYVLNPREIRCGNVFLLRAEAACGTSVKVSCTKLLKQL